MLLQHGHPKPYSYTPGRLGDEAMIVAERLNQEQASAAILLQLAISTQPVEATEGAIKIANEKIQTFQAAIKTMMGN